MGPSGEEANDEEEEEEEEEKVARVYAASRWLFFSEIEFRLFSSSPYFVWLGKKKRKKKSAKKTEKKTYHQRRKESGDHSSRLLEAVGYCRR